MNRGTAIVVALGTLSVTGALVSWGLWRLFRRERREYRRHRDALRKHEQARPAG